MINIDNIKTRIAKASPGPWEWQQNRHPNCNGTPWGWIEGPAGNMCWSGVQSRVDATFIAHARQDVPNLIAEVERLQDLLAERNVLLDKQDVELAESQRRERAAIRDLEEIATGADVCGYCKNTGEQCELCGVPVQDDTSPSNFEWCGPQEGRNERNGKV